MFDILPSNRLYLLPLLLLPVLWHILHSFLLTRRIHNLGSSAPRVRSWAPFGIDIAIYSIVATSTDRDLAFWHWLFSFARAGKKTIETDIGGQRFIFTADTENIKAILATQFSDYGKGEPFHEDWKDFLGDSIFTTDGELWHRSRQLIRPQFVKTRVADLEIFETHVQKLMRFIGGQGQEVDIAALFYRFTLDSATDYLLGQSVHSLDDPNIEFAAAFAELQRVQNMVGRIGPFNAFVPRRTFWAGLRVIDGFVKPFIEKTLSLDVGELTEKNNRSFLQALAATGTRDRKVIRDQVVAVLLAGRDTTAGALSFTFQELSRHPEIVERLRREIVEKVGLTGSPTYEDLKGMPYLQHTMNETLRLYPSVPFDVSISETLENWLILLQVRLALHDTTLPTGGGPDGMQPIGILKDTPIAYSTLLMQRRPDLYPPPSADFAPIEMFSPERWEKWQPKSWNYIPFNGGPRICIGQQFALTEMSK